MLFEWKSMVKDLHEWIPGMMLKVFFLSFSFALFILDSCVEYKKERALLIPVEKKYFKTTANNNPFHWWAAQQHQKSPSCSSQKTTKSVAIRVYWNARCALLLRTNTSHSVDLINLSLAVCVYLVRERKLIALNFYSVCVFFVLYVKFYAVRMRTTSTTTTPCLAMQNNKHCFHIHLILDRQTFSKTSPHHYHHQHHRHTIFGVDFRKIFTMILLRRSDPFPTAISTNPCCVHCTVVAFLFLRSPRFALQCYK